MNLNKLLLFFMIFAPDLALATIKMAVTVDDLPVHGKLAPGVSRLEIAKSILATLQSNHIPEVYGFINAISSQMNLKIGHGMILTHDAKTKMIINQFYA